MPNPRRRLLTVEEFEDIKKRRDWEAIRRRFVALPRGPEPTGKALTSTERSRLRRARLRKRKPDEPRE